MYEDRKSAFKPECFLPNVRQQRRDELKIIERGLIEAFLKVQSLRMDAAEGRKRGRSPERVQAASTLEQMQGRSLQSLKTDRQAQLEDNARRTQEYFEKAQRAFQEGDFHSTVEYCKLANQHNDKHAACYALLGQALAKNPAHRWQLQAEAAFKQALDLDRWNAKLYLAMAEFYNNQGLEQRAARLLNKAYEISPALRPEADAETEHP